MWAFLGKFVRTFKRRDVFALIALLVVLGVSWSRWNSGNCADWQQSYKVLLLMEEGDDLFEGSPDLLQRKNGTETSYRIDLERTRPPFCSLPVMPSDPSDLSTVEPWKTAVPTDTEDLVDIFRESR